MEQSGAEHKFLNIPELISRLVSMLDPVSTLVSGGQQGDRRSATQNLAQTRKGKRTAGKDFNFFRESA